MDIAALCTQMDALHASDLFLSVGKPVAARVLGAIRPLGPEEVRGEDIYGFFDAHLPPGTRQRLESQRDLDLGASLQPGERYRLNLYYQRGLPCMAVRRVPSGDLDFGELKIPDSVRVLAEQARGLVLITGATGSGKSTTLAAMLNHVNAHFQRHIVTIEDPIEFTHRDKQSVVSQREVGGDTQTFQSALRHVVRQNPDVIFIGEMRDLDTIRTAVSAAMTGHLVVTTMHTVDVAQTLERILNYFPAEMRDQMAQDLSLALAGVVSQRLLPSADGAGRVPVFEILVATPLVKRVLARRALDEIVEILKSGESDGMITFTRSLVSRCEAGLLTVETAATGATNREEFLLAAQGMETGIDSLRRLQEDTGSRLSIRKLLRDAVRYGASDLLLTVGSPPMIRIDGALRGFDMPELTAGDTRRLLFGVLTPSQRAHFEAEREVDFALSIRDRFGKSESGPETETRFRVNGYYQKGCVASAFRMIPQAIPSAEELRIPPVVMRLAQRVQGLILVTGPTGHGKSTTLACLIDAINSARGCHVVTVEDPIEFVHRNREAIIDQREVNADTRSFLNALKYVLRQDPDVILIGEMRDLETIAAALTAAETGHLVLATLHTNDATQTVDRIIDVFPAERQNQVRTQLAACLEAVVSQRLLPRKDGRGRIAAFEIMLGNTAVRSQIREKRTHQLLGIMETAAKEGMVTMDKALRDLFGAGLITREDYLSVARNPALGGGF
ncbi:MAG: PilT/PilU family type 4a pilus ATPase [Lentisphaeria bacterium]|nr:PilT/PilU family type 4a pilus ATPase [Lentisphaeria bacterium]